MPFAELMRLGGDRVSREPHRGAANTVGAALFAILTDEEREDVLGYLAWHRACRRSGRIVNGGD